MSTSPAPRPAVNPSPFNLAISSVHESIYELRALLHAMEREIDAYGIITTIYLAHIPKGDEPTPEEIDRVQGLASKLHAYMLKIDQAFMCAEGDEAHQAFEDAAIDGYIARHESGAKEHPLEKILDRLGWAHRRPRNWARIRPRSIRPRI